MQCAPTGKYNNTFIKQIISNKSSTLALSIQLILRQGILMPSLFCNIWPSLLQLFCLIYKSAIFSMYRNSEKKQSIRLRCILILVTLVWMIKKLNTANQGLGVAVLLIDAMSNKAIDRVSNKSDPCHHEATNHLWNYIHRWEESNEWRPASLSGCCCVHAGSVLLVTPVLFPPMTSQNHCYHNRKSNSLTIGKWWHSILSLDMTKHVPARLYRTVVSLPVTLSSLWPLK